MATSRNIFRSSRLTLRRGAQLLPAILMVGALVLGPLALVAYAYKGDNKHEGNRSSFAGGKAKGKSGGRPGWGGGKARGKSGGRPGWGGGHGHGHGPRGGSGNGSGTPGTGSGGGTSNPGTGGSGSGGSGTGGGTSNPGTGTGGGTTTPNTPGQGTGTPTGPGADGGVDNGGSGGGAGTPAAGGDTGAKPGGNTDQSTDAPSGGVVTDETVGSDGKNHSSKGKLDSKSGSGNSGSGSSSAGSRAVNAVQTSAVQPSVAVKPLLGSIISGDDDAKKSSSGSGKSAASKEKPDALRERTTIARAVDGIPLLFRAALLALIFATSILAVVSFRERRRATSVARIAQLDHLTGLANREGFDRQMAIEWQRALRHGRPLGMVFVDLDHFKSFNDTHGHVAGDRLLREVAAAITATSRASDFTARLGGDEFVVLCPDTDEDGLARLIERLRIEAAGMAVTLSIGAAGKLDSDQSPDELVHRADVAMYRSKGGRRRNNSSANPMLGSLRRG